MGQSPRPYVNCNFCNQRLILGALRLQQLQDSARVLLHCEGCGNRDHYEAGTVRDALLIPPGVARAAGLPGTLAGTALGPLPSLGAPLRRP